MGSFQEPSRGGEDRAQVEVWRKVARELVDSLQLVLNEPALDPSPTSLARFPKLDARWYEQQTKALEQRGFRLLRDLDGTPLTAVNCWPSMVRVLLSADGRTSAALYHVRPKAPGVLTFLLLNLLGKWPEAHRVVELSCALPDGAISTVNAENRFQPVPGSKRLVLEGQASVDELLAAHAAQVAGVPEVLQFADFEGLREAREAQRARCLRWRAEVGLLPVELDALLAGHGAQGLAVRPHIVEELRRRGFASR